jgi:sigma-B regulation protein RsbU (phosphoserine phosphatase)
MMAARSFLLPLIEARRDPWEILPELNDHVLRETLPGVFMTFLLLRWSPSARRLAFAGAGHEHILLHVPGEDLVREIPTGGIALGISPKARDQYTDRDIPFLPGHTVLLVSDGITEAMNPSREQFGRERLEASFLRRAAEPADVLCAGILSDVRAFAGPAPQSDDMTIVALRRA